MKANSKKQAWKMVDEIFPTDYMKDERSSANAGYDIYRSTADDRYYDYICDLGDRLEVNLSNGKTVNIWVEEAAEKKAPILDERVARYIADEIESLKGAAKSPFFSKAEDKQWCYGGISALRALLIDYGYGYGNH